MADKETPQGSRASLARSSSTARATQKLKGWMRRGSKSGQVPGAIIAPGDAPTINGYIPNAGTQRPADDPSDKREQPNLNDEWEVIYVNGDVFEGEFVKGLQNGKGMYTFANGDVYDGDWVDGKMHGVGLFRFREGTKYQGEVKDNRRDGRGSIRYLDGTVYEGEWKADHKSGRGVQTMSDGCRYEGEWTDNRRCGEGVYTEPDGTRFVGQWRRDLPNGRGESRAPDGSRYAGGWKDGLPHGDGVMEFCDGKRYDGQWVDGVPNGFGVMFDPFGPRYEGEWRKAQPQDLGTYYSPSGSMYGGSWVGGVWTLVYGFNEWKAASEVSAGGTSELERTLADPAKRECLLEYAERNFQTENLYFLLRVAALKQRKLAVGTQEMRDALRGIVDDFVSQKSQHEINIDGSLRERTLAAVEETGDVASLDKAVAEVWRILEYDVWRTFKASPEYATLLTIPQDQPPGGEQFTAKRIRFGDFS